MVADIFCICLRVWTFLVGWGEATGAAVARRRRHTRTHSRERHTTKLSIACCCKLGKFGRRATPLLSHARVCGVPCWSLLLLSSLPCLLLLLLLLLLVVGAPGTSLTGRRRQHEACNEAAGRHRRQKEKRSINIEHEARSPSTISDNLSR